MLCYAIHDQDSDHHIPLLVIARERTGKGHRKRQIRIGTEGGRERQREREGGGREKIYYTMLRCAIDCVLATSSIEPRTRLLNYNRGVEMNAWFDFSIVWMSGR